MHIVSLNYTISFWKTCVQVWKSELTISAFLLQFNLPSDGVEWSDFLTLHSSNNFYIIVVWSLIEICHTVSERPAYTCQIENYEYQHFWSVTFWQHMISPVKRKQWLGESPGCVVELLSAYLSNMHVLYASRQHILVEIVV